MNYIKHTALTFCKNNHLERKEITYKRLMHSARQNGYIVKTYSASDELLIYYGLYDRAQKSSSVSVTDENENVLIFIDDSLSKNKQRFALAHEIGHIVLEHKPNEKTKRKQEREADWFAHYLLTETAPKRLSFVIALLSAMLCLCIILITALLSLTLMKDTNFEHQKAQGEKTTVSAPAQDKDTVPADKVTVAPPPSSSASSPPTTANSSKEQTDICYYTEHGTVYHLYRDCSYLKNSQNVYTSKINECPLDRLCSRCANR